MENQLAFYVDFYVKEEKVQEWIASAKEVINQMSKEETFVLSYMHQDANDKTHFTLYERWNEKSMEDFIKNQLEDKEYRHEYEKKLPAMLKRDREFTVLKTLQAW